MTLHNTTIAANRRAQARAEEHGFASEAEMLPLLYQTMTAWLMGEILEVHAATVRFRLTKLHVKLRPRGGKRNFAGRPKKVVSSKKIVVVEVADNRPDCPLEACPGKMARSAEWLKQWVCLKCGKTAPLDPVEPVEDDIVTIHRVGCRGHSKGSGRRKQQMNCEMDFGFEDVYG